MVDITIFEEVSRVSGSIRMQVVLGACAALMCSPALAGVEFANETASRIDPGLAESLFVDDVDEKDYAWGDIDQDGDDDLIVVRKNPFSDSIGRVNLLLMNENGLLVDRTAKWATAADDGGQGFLDETPDRDEQRDG